MSAPAPAHPVRFVYAANLRLDGPLRDTGPLPDDLRTIVQAATLTAWNRIVDECLHRDVDFLLLSGNLFDADDPGVRGQAALLAGCERLDAADISVVIREDERVSPSVCLPGMRWPDNVTFWDDSDSDSIDESFRLAVEAVAGHDAGSPQSLHPDETGPRGATLVESDASGCTRRELIPTAPVRWERCSFDLDRATSRDDLLLSMRSALRNLAHHDSDRLWLVDWSISLRDAVHEPPSRADLEASVREALRTNSGIDGLAIWSRRFRWLEVDVAADLESSSHGPSPSFDLHRDADIPLAAEYRRLVTAAVRQPRWTQRRLEESALHGGPWEARLAQLMEHIDESAITEHARRCAEMLFPVTSTNDSPRRFDA